MSEIDPDSMGAYFLEESVMAALDTSDPGAAARVNFAAAWLFAQVSSMNAENSQRLSAGQHIAYDELTYGAVTEQARRMALTGEMPND